MSNIKSLAASIDPNVKARDIKGLAGRTSNVYESIAIITKRARQLSNDLKRELHDKLEEFVVVTETIEEIHENKEQIEISRAYEKMPNPSILATQEFLEDKVYYRNNDDDLFR